MTVAELFAIRRQVDSLWTDLVSLGPAPSFGTPRSYFTAMHPGRPINFGSPSTIRARARRNGRIGAASKQVRNPKARCAEIIEALEKGLDFTESDEAPSAAGVCLATPMMKLG